MVSLSSLVAVSQERLKQGYCTNSLYATILYKNNESLAARWESVHQSSDVAHCTLYSLHTFLSVCEEVDHIYMPLSSLFLFSSPKYVPLLQNDLKTSQRQQ